MLQDARLDDSEHGLFASLRGAVKHAFQEKEVKQAKQSHKWALGIGQNPAPPEVNRHGTTDCTLDRTLLLGQGSSIHLLT